MLIRWVPWSKLEKAQDDPERVVGVMGSAFQLREKDGVKEPYLSANWSGHFGGDHHEGVTSAILQFENCSIQVKKKSVFAVGRVEHIKSELLSKGKKIRVYYAPMPDSSCPDEPHNPCHVAVSQIDIGDELLEALSRGAWKYYVPATDYFNF